MSSSKNKNNKDNTNWKIINNEQYEQEEIKKDKIIENVDGFYSSITNKH